LRSYTNKSSSEKRNWEQGKRAYLKAIEKAPGVVAEALYGHPG